MAEIQRNIVKRGGRSAASRLFRAKDDKEAIATWRLDLNRILHVFNVRSTVYVRQLLILYSRPNLHISHISILLEGSSKAVELGGAKYATIPFFIVGGALEGGELRDG